MILEKDDILKIVCDYYDLTEEEIFSETRKAEICLPRQVLYHFCTKYTGYSYRIVGFLRSEKTKHKAHDHATILHAKKKIKNLYDVDRKFILQYDEIEEKLKKKYESKHFTNMIPEKINLLDVCIRNLEYKNNLRLN